MLRDKAMIIIAVSKYAGAYSDLPGAITSARKLRQWAEQPDEDCNYKVLYLADDEYSKIDVDLLKDKIKSFLNENIIDRLVVYFAGHGIVKSAADQFWLLSDAADNLREGINVEAFRRGLLKCNIGASNNQISGQLCIIGDACRNTGRDALEFTGDPILTSTAKMNKRIQLDKFLSASLGNYSFHIDEAENQSAYCLFTEVLVDALRGQKRKAVENSDHRFKPAVTNHKIIEYLYEEIDIRAADLEEEIEPDMLPGIHPPYNFYKRLQDLPPADVTRSSNDSTSATATPMTSPEKRDDKRYKQTDHEGMNRFKLEIENVGPRPRTSTYCEFLPNQIAVPRSASVSAGTTEKDFYYIQTDIENTPILIQQDEHWVLAPSFPNVLTVIFHDMPGDILFLKVANLGWDTYLSDFSNLRSSAPLRTAEAQEFADKIRYEKSIFPHQSVTAGYLYEYSNDYNNISRTAHYMAQDTGSVPFDLALLCADKIEWRKENDRIIAYADLPKVVPQETDNNRPAYTKVSFSARKDCQLWGIAPYFTQGWRYMQTEKYLQIPESILQISEHTSGRSAASITNEGLELFLEAFDYKVCSVGPNGVISPLTG